MFDPATVVESLLRGTTPHAATNVFLVSIVVVLLWAIWKAKQHRNKDFINYAPTLMTTLGILGTFVGVVVGLLGFDPEHIDKSITGLLGGLQTAFITSIAGMVAAVGFKTLRSFGAFDVEGSEPGDVGPSEVLAALREQSSQLEALRKGLAGEDDGSVVGQLKQLRTDVRDGNGRVHEAFERLEKQFDEFARRLSEAATKQVIEALRRVIEDFNANLTEQFGDNFKQLNQAVESLVVWQRQYQEQLEEWARLFAEGVKTLEAAAKHLDEVREAAQAIPEAMERLTKILEVQKAQSEELESELGAFAEMRERAVEAVPKIEGLIEDAVTRLQSAADGLEGELKKIGAQLGTMANTVSEHSTEVAARMLEAVKEGGRLKEEVAQAMKAAADGLRGDLAKVAKETEETVNAQLRLIDDAMRQEVERVMERMGQALTTISETFVKDYRALVDRMRQIVRYQG